MSGVLINGNRLGRLHRDILAYLIKWGFWRLFFLFGLSSRLDITAF